jgi:putative hydrolase of the HAD superfamily
MAAIKNIIFDLGGIFIHIDYPRTEKAFIDLGVTQFPALYNQHHASDLFELLETGKVSPQEFYDLFRKETGLGISDAEIEYAWNAMLGDFMIEQVNWLNTIKDKYRIYLFSNTNKIHHVYFTKLFKEITGADFDAHFIKAYYSHELGLRKPYPESFTAILNREGLLATETLFIDDTYKNIAGAAEAGLQTSHVVYPLTIDKLGL